MIYSVLSTQFLTKPYKIAIKLVIIPQSAPNCSQFKFSYMYLHNIAAKNCSSTQKANLLKFLLNHQF